MRRSRARSFALSFQDMLMAMIAIYAFLFLIAYALISVRAACRAVQGETGTPGTGSDAKGEQRGD